MPTETSFHCEVENAPNDARGNKVTVVKCHGKLVKENTQEISEAVRPLLPVGGRIVVDLSDLDYLDSSGLGSLVGLKVSALKQGMCILEFTNMTPRVLELLRITNLAKILTS